MPLFMLISGYFFYVTVAKNQSVKRLIVNRTTRLLLPILSWNIIYFFIYKYNFSSIQITYFIKSIITDLWFLWAVFWCSFIVIFVRKLLHDNIYIYVLVFIVSFIIPDFLNLDLYKFLYPYFVIGYLFHRNKENISSITSKLKPIYLLSIITIVYLILMSLFNTDSYIYTTGFTIIGKQIITQIYIDLYRFLVGLAGSIIVILAIGFLLKQNVTNSRKIIAKLGQESLGIYIISGFFLPLLSNNTTQFSLNYLYTIIETLIIILTSYTLIVFLKRYKLANKILFGGR